MRVVAFGSLISPVKVGLMGAALRIYGSDRHIASFFL